MGQSANRKWPKRVDRVRKARTVSERLRLLKLFAGHPKFKKAADR